MHKCKKTLLFLCLAILFISFPNMTKAAASQQIYRLGGVDRYETAVKVSQDGFVQSDYVVLASGRDFPDALSAAPLAKKYNAPILLTDGKSLSYSVSQEILRLGVKNAFIIGGTGVISPDVEKQLKTLNVNSIRIGGVDRYDTSVKVAAIIGTSNGIVLASGESFPDALSIAPIAAAKQMPILLTPAKSMPDIVKNFIKNNPITKSYIIGGTGVISSDVAQEMPKSKRLYGPDRYQTNLAVLNEFSAEIDFSRVYLATGMDYPDALGGAASAAKISSPIILIDKNYKFSQEFIRQKSRYILLVKVLGGTGAVSDMVVKDVLSPSKVVLGYTIKSGYYDNSSYSSLLNYGNMVDEVATYTFTTDSFGNITGSIPYDILGYAGSNNKTALALVTNNFDPETAKFLLESQENRGRLINNILNELVSNNYKGVNIDIEGIYYYNRPHFNAFMRELYNMLHSLGFEVTVAVPAKTWDNPSLPWTGGYDYREIGKYADRMVLMTYDEHWSGGTPGPIASIGWVQKVIDYALTVIPQEKIMLGIAAYGYDWPSNNVKARAYGISTTYSIAASKGVEVKWDNVSKSPYFNYIDSLGVYHTVWFENAESIGYKLDIVNDKNLYGIAIWRLGLENQDFWAKIKDKFKR